MHRSHYAFKCIALLFAAALLLLTGCAATGPKPVEMQTELNRIPASKGRIYFYRSSSIVGAAMQPNISLNGSIVGESKPGGFFYVDVEPGIHEATSRTEVTSKVSVTVRDGQSQYVRSAIGFGIMVGRVELTLIDPAQGQQEISSLSFTGSRGIAGPPIATIPPSAANQQGGNRVSPPKPVTLEDLDALFPKK